MKKAFLIVLVAACLAGCATTKSNVSMEYASDEGRLLSVSIEKGEDIVIADDQYAYLESSIKNSLSKKNLLAYEGYKPEHIVTVKIHSYRMRDDAARLAVGIMAGCDNIKSTVVVTDAFSKEKLGSSEISISECAAWGVANQVIEKYAQGVVAYLAGK